MQKQTLKTSLSPKWLFFSLRVRRSIKRVAQERQEIERQMRLELLSHIRQYH